MSDMWVVVYANEGMDQGHVYLSRELSGDEIIHAVDIQAQERSLGGE